MFFTGGYPLLVCLVAWAVLAPQSEANDLVHNCNVAKVTACSNGLDAKAKAATTTQDKCKYALQLRMCYVNDCSKVTVAMLNGVKQLLTSINLSESDCPGVLDPYSGSSALSSKKCVLAGGLAIAFYFYIYA